MTKKSASLCYQFIQEYLVLVLLSISVSYRICNYLEDVNKETKIQYYHSKIEHFMKDIDVQSNFIKDIGLDNNADDDKLRFYSMWRSIDVTKGKNSLKYLMSVLPSTKDDDTPNGIEWPKMIDKKLEGRVLFFDESSTEWGKQYLSWLVLAPNEVPGNKQGNFGCSEYCYFSYSVGGGTKFGGCAGLNIEPLDNEYYKIKGPLSWHGYYGHNWHRFENVCLSVSSDKKNIEDGYGFTFNWNPADWNDLLIIPVTKGDWDFNGSKCMIMCKQHDDILFVDKYGWSNTGGKVFQLEDYHEYVKVNESKVSSKQYQKDDDTYLDEDATTLESSYKVKDSSSEESLVTTALHAGYT
eukprot:489636_1